MSETYELKAQLDTSRRTARVLRPFQSPLLRLWGVLGGLQSFRVLLLESLGSSALNQKP